MLNKPIKLKVIWLGGFSILEVMIAVAVITALAAGLYRLQIASINSTQQILLRQNMLNAANSIIQQMQAHEIYTSSNATTKLPGYASSCSANPNSSCYAETNYLAHTASGSPAAAAAGCCGSLASLCDDNAYAACVLSNWKRSFTSLNIPAANIAAIVCADGSYTPPTLSATNCSGSGNLVVKIVWQAHVNDVESAAASNYVMLKVPQR